MILFSISCSNEPITETISGSQDVDIISRATHSTVSVFENPNGPEGDLVEIMGTSSTIHRNENGITVNFKTENLIPNNVYTLWWVVFGNPTGPPTLITYAAGHITGGNGKGNFSSHLNVGPDFNNPLTAEVHLALRSHGPLQPDMMPEQIQTINGGCTSGYESGPALYPDSDVVGYCANVQVAMHPSN